MGMKGMTSAAPSRGCAPVCFVRSINSAALPDAANYGFLHLHGIAHQRDDAAIMVGVHLAIEKVNAIHLHGFKDGVNFGLVAAFREVRNTFDECRHKRRG